MLGALLRALHQPFYSRRIRVLADQIVGELEAGDQVLDVGCGGGGLGAEILAHPDLPEEVVVEGLERSVRGGEPIDVHPYPGGDVPFRDGRYDVVVIADVLHHETDPEKLLRECRRVAKRSVIVKDHKTEGALAQFRVSLLDWAANRGYGVTCLFKYLPTAEAWGAFIQSCGLEVTRFRASMDLYPVGFNWFFGGRLHYLAVCRVS